MTKANVDNQVNIKKNDEPILTIDDLMRVSAVNEDEYVVFA